MTRHAASCWYNAVESSCLVSRSCFRRLNVSRAKASHSDWKTERREGSDVKFAGRGRAISGTERGALALSGQGE